MIFSIPLAWLQLIRQRVRFLVTLAGIAFIVILLFMQIGFQNALYASATFLHQNLRGDLFLISSQYKSITSKQPFPRSRLYQTLGVNGVQSVSPLYLEFAKFKNPETGQKSPIYILGFDPASPVFNSPEVEQNLDVIKFPNRVLFDRASRPEFGPIAEEFAKGKSIEVEIFPSNARDGYSVEIGGLFSLGPSFGVDGNLIVNYLTILQIFLDRQAEEIDLGLITLNPGVNPQEVLAYLSAYLPQDIRVLTRQSFIEFEKEYWTARTPIGFVFSSMVIMGFVVGVVVVYQILYSNISNHLAEYATLKAIGFKHNYLSAVIFQQALLLAILGYIPGFIISFLLYDLAKATTHLPVMMSVDKALTILCATIGMCWISGWLSANKLQSTDPADIF